MTWLSRWRRHEQRSSEDEAGPELAALLERARALPREARPGRDLWQGVRNRIEAAAAPSPPGGWRVRLQVPVWAAALVVGLLLLSTAIGTVLWLGASPSLDDPAAVRVLADALRDRDGMSGVRRDLLALLDERRDRLPAEVVVAVEKNLAEIDRAIAEIHLAFEQHPEHSALKLLLAETYRREAEMLEQLEWWTRAPGLEARS